MVGVGINENIVIKSVGQDEKGRLFIELAEAGKVEDLFTAMTQTGYSSEGNGSLKLNILSFLVPKQDPTKPTKTVDQNVMLVAGDISRLKNQLTQILEQFMLQANIDLGAPAIAYAGTGIIDSATMKANLLRQDILDMIYKNMVGRFIQLLNGIGQKDPVRFKLIRQSKDKHYATIPSRFVEDNPFIELMTVPKAGSRLKFTPYELKEGLNDGTPTTAAASAENKSAGGPGAAPGAPVTSGNPFAPAATQAVAPPPALPVVAAPDVAAPVQPVSAAPTELATVPAPPPTAVYAEQPAAVV